MEANLLPVDVHGGLVVDRLEVQQHILAAVPVRGHLEGGRKPHGRRVEHLEARDGALDTARDQRLVLQRRAGDVGHVGGIAGPLVRPDAVQGQPVLPLELRARVFWPWVQADLVGPWRVERGRLELVWHRCRRRARAAAVAEGRALGGHGQRPEEVEDSGTHIHVRKLDPQYTDLVQCTTKVRTYAYECRSGDSLRDDTLSQQPRLIKEGKGSNATGTADEEQKEPGADLDKLEKGAGRPVVYNLLYGDYISCRAMVAGAQP